MRPRLETEGDTKNTGGRSSTILPPTPDTAKQGDLAARARRHDYAVRVVSERRDGVLVTQYMTDLPAAERKKLRVEERGLRCELHLVRIIAVGVTPLPLLAMAADLERLLEVGA